MNKTQFETYVNQIQERSQNPRLVHLCEAFKAFMALYVSRNQKRDNPEAFEKKLQASYRTMWESFYAVANSFGLDAGKFLEHMSNSEHLNPEEMQAMTRIRESFEAIQGPASNSPKEKKSKKKVRI